MAFFSSSSLASAALAVFALSAIMANARILIETDKVSVNELCATASYRDLCFSMLKNTNYKDEFEMATDMLQQARQKIRDATAEAEKLSGAAGAQAKYINRCKSDYQGAERMIQTAINAFAHPIQEFEQWNRYLNATQESARSAYDCVAAWEDSRPTEKFLLEGVSTNLYQFMFNTYDLTTKLQVHTN